MRGPLRGRQGPAFGRARRREAVEVSEVRVHEWSVATEAYRVCREHLEAEERHGGRMRIESVRLAVGELSAVEPDLLVFAWTALVAGGPDDGARLDIEWRPARQRCPACGEVPGRAPGSWLRLCPECGEPLAIEGGDELDVLRIIGVLDEAGEGPAT